ncbi:MAG: hypothetical protein MHMPM18_000215 [Marteilia pararefringens]
MDSSNVTGATDVTEINSNKCGILTNFMRPEYIQSETTLVPEKWPWKALFKSGGEFFFEGSLIASEWILTSRYCIEKHYKDNKNAKIKVVLGYHNSDQLPYSHTTRYVTDIIIHPEYDLVEKQNNIALVRVSRVNLSAGSLSTICLPDQDSRSLPDGTICRIASSNLHKDDSATTVFKKISMEIISNSECQQLYGGRLTIRDSMICATNIKNGSSVYQGFSGGSLVCYDEKMSRFIQIGVNNGRPKQTGTKYPLVLSKTSKVRSWIDETIAEYKD